MLSAEPMQMALPVTLPDDETFASYFGGEDSLKRAFQSLPTNFSTLICAA